MEDGPLQARLDGLRGDGGVGADVVQHGALAGLVDEDHRRGRRELGVDPVDEEVRSRDRLMEGATEEVVAGGDDELGLDAHAGQHASGPQGRSAFGRGEQ
jgi:hypothetical protein